MPREKIAHPTPRIEGDHPRFLPVVGWNRDMDVQFGLEAENDHHLVDVIYGDEDTRAEIYRLLIQRLDQEGVGAQASDAIRSLGSPETVGRWILDAVTGSTPYGGSIWWHPGRQQINALIRLLRKARDAAFGRDE